ncbi:mevalonate kinase [Ruoffia sp. FAM 24228]|uniref:mevalonate kinase n=1 Tax=unclassified Ruoffia TaxID=2862149 RepID=UPI000ECD1A6B|nr:mevalonate kinase [Aerococcaceae bacterium]
MDISKRHNYQSKLMTSNAKQLIGIGKAHSKIILMGEHAVVYDYPAIALPFNSANVTVTITPSKSNHTYIHSSYYDGIIEDAPESLDNLKQAIEVTLSSFKLANTPMDITIDSSIPSGRGMGSSAAVSVALVRALCDFYKQEISNYQLNFIVNQAEVIAHESTSGLDTLLASTNSPVIYRKSQTAKTIKINLDAYLVVADSDMPGQTKTAVSKVRQLKESKPDFIRTVMRAIGGFVQQSVDAIQAKDINELGRLMTYNHYYLNQLEISNAHIDRIVNAAWIAGALGAKLTGGGFGGCVIALAQTKVEADLIQQAMMDAGATKTWSLDLKTI